MFFFITVSNRLGSWNKFYCIYVYTKIMRYVSRRSIAGAFRDLPRALEILYMMSKTTTEKWNRRRLDHERRHVLTKGTFSTIRICAHLLHSEHQCSLDMAQQCCEDRASRLRCKNDTVQRTSDTALKWWHNTLLLVKWHGLGMHFNDRALSESVQDLRFSSQLCKNNSEELQYLILSSGSSCPQDPTLLLFYSLRVW